MGQVRLFIQENFLAVLAVLSVSLSVAVTGGHAAAQDIPRDGPEYKICYEKLTQEPLASYSSRVAEGGPENTRRILLETELVGVRCSDGQLIAFMEHHGMPYHSKIEREDTFEGIQGSYNRILDFCVRYQRVLERLFFGECGGVTRFMMLDDKVSYMVSHGFRSSFGLW